MEKVERFTKAYEHLMGLGVVHKRKDVAERMDVSEPNISRVFKGNPKYLTDKFLFRFNNAFGCVFNYDWLTTGEGEMLKTSTSEDSMEKLKIDLLQRLQAREASAGEPAFLIPPKIGEVRTWNGGKGGSSRGIVERLYIAMPEVKNESRTGVLTAAIQNLLHKDPSVGLWVATGEEGKTIVDVAELMSLKSQIRALQELNKAQVEENKILRERVGDDKTGTF